MRLIGDLLFNNPRINSSRPAIFWDGGEWSYAEFLDRVSRVAAALKREGISRGDRVSVLMGNEPQYFVSYFAITSIGAIYVPLNWRLLPAEHVNLMSNAGVKVLITSSEFNATINAAKSGVASLSRVVVAGEGSGDLARFDDWAAQPAEPPTCDGLSPDDIAAIVYTSGTTSLPKGACLTHGNVVVDLEHVAIYAHPASTDTVLQITPLYHQTIVHSLVHLAHGAAIRLHRRFNAEASLKAISDSAIDYVFLAPTMLYELLDCPNRSSYKLSSLKTIVYGAAPVTGARLKEAVAVFGKVLVHAYGLTEATSHCTYLDRAEHLLAEGSIGRAMPGVEVRIVDDQVNDCVPGQIGEIIIRGPTVMKGYWGDVEKTAETIVNGWLHSGDLGRKDERGYLYIVDRKKDLVISGGANIYPSDIEEVFAKHPAVAEVAAFGVPDDYWGEALTVAVVARPNRTLNSGELITFAKQHLGGYQVPKRLEILDELPRNPSGKILKRVLREKFTSPSTKTT
jgi:acyl-CoA synthetase (AMP-forming)/AMP-acid ligase II